MSVLCLGLNHKTAPVEIREKLSLSETRLPEVLKEVCGLEGIQETVVLSTCNRMEIYAVAESLEAGRECLTGFLHAHHSLSPDEESVLYRHEDLDAARHLFAVASGLDSMVLGETEIFGQVKSAYRIAHQNGSTSRGLNKMFQEAFRIGKLVRSNTRITRGSTSVGSVAVDLAEKIFGQLDHCQVMIIGAGDMSRRTAKSLLSRGAKSIIVSNRTYDRAVELADEMNGVALHFDDWMSSITKVDIMITSTSAPHTFIHAGDIAEAMRRRRGRPLFVIDIAVPRDVDSDVNEVDSVYLYDIDTLESIAVEGRRHRAKQVHECEQLIASAMEDWDIPADLFRDGRASRDGRRGDDLTTDLSPAHE